MKKNFRNTVIALVTILPMCFSSCQKDDAFVEKIIGERKGSMDFLDIVDAKSLIIDMSMKKITLKNGEQINAPGMGLFKVTENGVYQEIDYYRIDTVIIEGEDSTYAQLDTVELTDYVYPKLIFNATSDYIIACFEEQNPENQFLPNEYNYLVRKSDGAVFVLPGPQPAEPYEYWDHGMIFMNEDGSMIIQTDANDNIYYLGGWKVNKISTSNPSSLTYQELTSSVETVANFITDSDGNVVYMVGREYKYKLSTGGISYPQYYASAFWLGLDDKFYFDFKYDDYAMPIIGRSIISGSNISYEVVDTIQNEYMGFAGLGGYYFKMKSLNKIVIISGGFSGSPNPVLVVNEVYNNDNQVKSFLLSDLGLTAIGIGKSSENFYYLSGMLNNQPGLIKVDPSVFPHTASNVIPLGEYDIYSMAISTDDEIIFNALRMSDGKIVLGEISANGSINIVNEVGGQVVQMVQIQ